MASYLPIASSGARSRPSSPRFVTDAYETESLSSDDAPSGRNTYTVPTHYRHHHHHHHHHVFAHTTNSSSNLTSAHQTPTHSRPGSPSPRMSATGYFCSDDDQVYNPLIGRVLNGARGSTHRKWFSDVTPSRRRSSRRRASGTRIHGCRRVLQVIVDSPFFPAQPATIVSDVLASKTCTYTWAPFDPAPVDDNCVDCRPFYNTFPHVLAQSRQSPVAVAVLLCDGTAVCSG